MAPLVLEGDNLGERHRNYNKIVKEKIDQNHSTIQDLNYEESDVENLIRIDVACNKRDIQYILNVFKSKDMLYVSRAIKQSTWLTTENQFDHIINPRYLFGELFPQMLSKAVNKLLLSIRLNLKDEPRVEVFFNYFKDKDFKTALKWLPHCSLALVEAVVKERQSDIDAPMLKRLCEKSISVLEAFVYKNEQYIVREVSETVDLIYKDPERYLDILESLQYPVRIQFGPKRTKFIMKKCPDRIINKFEKYCGQIDCKTFAKYFKTEDIKDFILKLIKEPTVRDWFIQKNVKHFIKELPEKERFEFLKKVFIEKDYEKVEDAVTKQGKALCSPAMACRFMSSSSPSSNSNIYKWYTFASFDVAFIDLKKLIRTESSPEERNAMFTVLLTCAGQNMKHLNILLQYYKEKHINEAFKFKSQFVGNVISATNTHRYDKATWNILNELFHCMEVYIKSDNNVQPCINCIIIYKILHNEVIPTIIEEKFSFNTMKKLQKKLTEKEKAKVFKFLYDFAWKRVTDRKVDHKVEFEECLGNLMELMTSLIDWEMDVKNYPDILNKIREFIKLNNDKSWGVSLSDLYETKKDWRKYMFEESFELKLSEEVCINALKHDMSVFVRNSKKMEVLARNDAVSLKRLLSKLRIYYSHSLAKYWLEHFKERLDTSGGHKALVLGICALMPHKELTSLIEHYEPKVTKIVYSEADEVMLSFQKQIAKNMYTSRPQPSLETVLRYAKGDYLQYTLPSVHSILNNVSPISYRAYLPTLLETPVSLQKHSIRVVLKKLKPEELIQIFSEIWKSTKNSSIRAVVFRQTFNLLCKEKGAANKVWKLINSFMDDLSSDENKEIFTSLCNVKHVPEDIQGPFCMKSYKILKNLPAKTNVDSTIDNLLNNSKDFVDKLDSDFVINIATEFINNDFGQRRLTYKDSMKTELITSYLLCGKDSKFQEKMCENIVNPIFEQVYKNMTKYSETDEHKKFFVILNLIEFLESLCQGFQKIVLVKDMDIPVLLFSEILAKVETLNLEKNYVTIRFWKLAVAFVKIMRNQQLLIVELGKKDDSQREKKWNILYKAAASDVADTCVVYLRSDTVSFFPSIYLHFTTAMENLFVNFNLDEEVRFEIYKHLLKHSDLVEIYLSTLSMLPNYFDDDCKEVYKQLRKTIFDHPSKEVKMRYYTVFNNCCDPE